MRNPFFQPHPLITATIFPSKDEAVAVVALISADDHEWSYEINRLHGDRYVITVHEVSDIDTGDHYFLGYL